jgi:hypothetical protein
MAPIDESLMPQLSVEVDRLEDSSALAASLSDGP